MKSFSNLMSSYEDSIVIKYFETETDKDKKYNLLNLWLVEDALTELRHIWSNKSFAVGETNFRDIYVTISNCDYKKLDKFPYNFQGIYKINDLESADISTIIDIINNEMVRKQASRLLELPSFTLNGGL